MKSYSFGLSDRGLEREENEDNFAISDELGLYVVADGMGGHSGGKVASEIAVNTLLEFFARYKKDKDFTWPYRMDPNLNDEENALMAGIKLANRQIFSFGSHKREYAGMGTTIVTLFVHDNDAFIANVGDSRCYHLRENEIKQISTDHTWVNEQRQKNIISAEEARQHRWRNVITRALGNKRSVDIDLVRMQIEAGDYFVLCSDGLSNMVEDEEIRDIIIKNEKNIEESVKHLIDLARDRGGPDNITLLAVYYI